MPNAILSVFDKTGIADFARGLSELGWRIYSSGGTARTIAEAGVPVTDIATLVGGGAILGHGVVTLSREVHAGILARRDHPEDLAELAQAGIPLIDMVVVDPYPFHRVLVYVERPEDFLEHLDVGGPAMIAAAIKRGRIVVCDPRDYEGVLDRLRSRATEANEMVWRIFRRKAVEFLAGYHTVLAWSFQFNARAINHTIVSTALCALREQPNRWPSTASFFSEISRLCVFTDALHDARHLFPDSEKSRMPPRLGFKD